MKTAQKTIVGEIDPAVLAFTAGRDRIADGELVEADCIGSAAHVTMLSELNLDTPVLTASDRDRIVERLVGIMKSKRAGKFKIAARDQDVHLAVERWLVRDLGELGRRVHAARSRNDQAATDLRLYAKVQLLDLREETAELALCLLSLASRHARTPMVGRTHMQPAMPSSVGLWASAYAESLLDDLALLDTVYRLNNRCPLGSAAGYGVALPIRRRRTAALLDFERPVRNVIHAGHTRGKCESVILSACLQVMLTLSRFAEDVILFTAPEFGYFELPAGFATGSSIMPQKRNPDVPELIRGRTARVQGALVAVQTLLKALPMGYNRDLQETKEPLLEGLRTVRDCVRVLRPMIKGMKVNRARLEDAFSPSVFATDEALGQVAAGKAFRDAYDAVKANLDAVREDEHRGSALDRFAPGGPADPDLAGMKTDAKEVRRTARAQRRVFHRRVSSLLGVRYPDLD